ncbi:hypothetical protein DICVIV_02468 [Dictyocaulus viviparus]|uniref:Uncharacterized protein n=1 Tax=Dictyocaulus viviparus TaxID=29172 RepID=A0A0D8Y5T9_DICVI|nr:hypothetical protein DICVIV_02468 [Dictyocaulus viviparus]
MTTFDSCHVELSYILVAGNVGIVNKSLTQLLLSSRSALDGVIYETVLLLLTNCCTPSMRKSCSALITMTSFKRPIVLLRYEPHSASHNSPQAYF